jgi:Large polyvalent protein associated domain 29
MPTTQQLTDGSTRLNYSTKETAVAIRVALKTAFPGVKFSVTTSYGSMTSSTTIRWTDGPTQPEVDRITDQYSSKTFDGMDDSTHYHEQQQTDGQRVQYSGWVTTRREYSVALLTLALARFQQQRAEYGLPPADLQIVDGSYPHVAGRDANSDAGVSPIGYRYAFRYCSDAVQSIAHHLRPNGFRVILKDGR